MRLARNSPPEFAKLAVSRNRPPSKPQLDTKSMPDSSDSSPSIPFVSTPTQSLPRTIDPSRPAKVPPADDSCPPFRRSPAQFIVRRARQVGVRYPQRVFWNSHLCRSTSSITCEYLPLTRVVSPRSALHTDPCVPQNVGGSREAAGRARSQRSPTIFDADHNSSLTASSLPSDFIFISDEQLQPSEPPRAILCRV